MEMTRLGHSAFRIKTKTAVVATDPFSPQMLGFKFPKVEADIVTVSHAHEDHNFLEGIVGEPFVIDLPGEYEVKGVSIFGYQSSHNTKPEEQRGKNTIYIIEAEGLKVAHLGDLGTFPGTEVMEEISGVDVLLIPVGGIATIGPKQAAELVGKVEPVIAVPMHYKEAGINEEVFGDFSPVEGFLEAIGIKQAERLDKLSITKDKLPQEAKVFVLERKG